MNPFWTKLPKLARTLIRPSEVGTPCNTFGDCVWEGQRRSYSSHAAYSTPNVSLRCPSQRNSYFLGAPG